MKRSIATVSLSGTLPEKLEAISAAGFDGVEVFENDLLYYEGHPGNVRQMCADLGLEITLFQPFRDFEGAPRSLVQRNLDRAERKFDLMQELGTDLVLVCSNASANSMGDESILLDDLALLSERAGARNLRIGYEALAWGRHVSTWQQVWNLVRKVDHQALGVLLDSFHTLSLKGDPAGIAEIPGNKIFFVQMADAPELAMDVLEWSRHFRCFPGQGVFDLPGFLAPILMSGYNGPLSLEIFNDGFRAAPPRANAADGLRSLLYLEEKTRQRLGKKSYDVASNILFKAAEPSRYDGIEFLEFAVDEEKGARLTQWLSSLGFSLKGQHRSKAVSLMSQGDINIVLNAEPYCFAQNFYENHGPSLCATAFRVSDAESALKRAQDYNRQPFRGLVGPNEREIPAIRAHDGSLIYLVEQSVAGTSIYESDFNIDQAVHVNRDLKTIDHIAMALPAEGLESTVLFYKTIFDFEADDEFVLPDPYGLVKSRAVRSSCATIRLPLNVSENSKTAISHAISSYRGSGVHHIAFSCDDIFEQAKRAKEAGVPLLAIPRNYYNDLGARLGIDDGYLSKLANFNILYDRDPEGGEFYHFYTESFDNRFFFEIVQRKGGYQGYGATNVAVRHAAMAASRKGRGIEGR